MNESSPRVRILIASYLEAHQVDRIRALDPRLEVVYEPHLLPRPRFAADHVGHPLERPEDDEKLWVSLLADAEVLFDFDRTHLEDLPERVPSVRWIQATSAGIGQLVAKHRYAERMPETVFTTASGVHAIPLAEYALMSILLFRRKLPEMLAGQRERRWEPFASTDLAGRSLAVVGMGSIGSEVARVASGFGMRVLGVKRTVAGVEPASLHSESLYPFDELHAALSGAEHLVLAAPHTPETEGMIGAAELALLAPGAIFVNVARGALVDEAALVDALESGRLGGAALDVFRDEPLPADSPFWTIPNVMVCSHSAGTSDRENERITDIFCENLHRYLEGEPLLNVLDVVRMY
ncbi:MAG: D-2-hydroxyacid dehydrogenase [Gemmatimonadetes bacterium]|nr:D-2-hydroxyacid dehydrogenase [Gemmatimonadota bacterium]